MSGGVARGRSIALAVALNHLREIANAWAFVAAGGTLIAIDATWNLRENYGWPEWGFWTAAAAMLLISIGRTAKQIRRRRAQRSSMTRSATSNDS